MTIPLCFQFKMVSTVYVLENSLGYSLEIRRLEEYVSKLEYAQHPSYLREQVMR